MALLRGLGDLRDAASDAALRVSLSARPMSKAFAQQQLSRAGMRLVQQGATNVSDDPLSTTSTELGAAAVMTQRIADDLHAVNDSGDPIPDDLADEVERAVIQALGLENVIASQVKEAAGSVWHWLGMPKESPKPGLPSWLPSMNVLLIGGLILGGYLLLRRRV